MIETPDLFHRSPDSDFHYKSRGLKTGGCEKGWGKGEGTDLCSARCAGVPRALETAHPLGSQ